MKYNILLIILRTIVGGVFIFSAVSKLLVADDFELYIYSKTFLSWNLSIAAARIIIGAELAMGLLLICNVFTPPNLIVIITMLAGFTLWLGGNLIFNRQEENCYCFGDALHLNTALSIVKNLVLIALVAFLYLKRPSAYSKSLIITLLILVVAFIGPSVYSPPDFLMRGFYADKKDVNVNNIPEAVFNNAKVNGDPELIAHEPRVMLCFLSTGCVHCKKAATLIGNMQRKAGNTLHIVYIFYEEPGTFLEDNASEDMPYYVFDSSIFFWYNGKGVPSIFLTENNNIIEKYSYRSLNEKEILSFLSEEGH